MRAADPEISSKMSASPLERITPALGALTRQDAALPRGDTLAGALTLRPQLAVLTAFWIYVALSNVLYANSMQASFSNMKMERVFAPWDARLIQHLVLYPLFLLSMWRSMRTGWQPLWRAIPLQLLCALGFAVLASPSLVLGEYLTHEWHGEMWHNSDFVKTWGSWQGFAAHEIPIWVASITSFLVTYGFGLALVMGFAFYQRLRDSQLHSAALEREFSRLSDELQFVTLYLELQQRRFADRLTIEVPAREAHARAWVPSLILQPLVENAVVHGLAGHEGAVTIRVEAR